MSEIFSKSFRGLPHAVIKFTEMQLKGFNENFPAHSEDWSDYMTGYSAGFALPRYHGNIAQDWILSLAKARTPNNDQVTVVDLGAVDAGAFTGLGIEPKTEGLIDILIANGLRDVCALYAFNGGKDLGKNAREMGVKYAYGNMFADFRSFIPQQGADILLARKTLYQSILDLLAFEIANISLRNPDYESDGGIGFNALCGGFDGSLIFTPDGRQLPVISLLDILKNVLGWDLEYHGEYYIHVGWRKKKELDTLPIKLIRISKEFGDQFKFLRAEYELDGQLFYQLKEMDYTWEESEWYKRMKNQGGRKVIKELWTEKS